MRAVHAAVKAAITAGVLPAPTRCEACQMAAKSGSCRSIVYHHHDYDKPLDVIPLCQSCHRKVHAGSLVEPRTGRIYKSWQASRAEERAEAERLRVESERLRAEALLPLVEGWYADLVAETDMDQERLWSQSTKLAGNFRAADPVTSIAFDPDDIALLLEAA